MIHANAANAKEHGSRLAFLGSVAVALALVLFAAAASVVAEMGAVGPSFATDGTVLNPIGSGDDQVAGVAVQSDGKIVVAGRCMGALNIDFCLARYTAAGILDGDFGTAGKVSSPIGTGVDRGYGMAMQVDGKFVIAGQCAVGDNYDFCLARFTTSGLPDSDFGTGGVVITPVGSSSDGAYAVALQADGKIVAAGACTVATDDDFCLARYTTEGDLDPDFGKAGLVITPIGASYDYGRAVAVQADGKIIVAGFCYGASNVDFCLARYTTLGELDSDFGSGGKIISPIGSFEDEGQAVAVQADGKVILAGGCYVGAPHYDFCLIRYDSEGDPDGGFGTGGKVFTPMGPSADKVNALALQPDGKIVAAGACSMGPNNNDFCLARYSSGGVLDADFGTGGKVITEIGQLNDSGIAVAFDSNGRIVLAGECNGSNSYDFCVARYFGFAVDTDDDGYSDLEEFALTPAGDPETYCAIMRADVNHDHVVTIGDLASVAGAFLQSVTPETARFDQGQVRDGIITIGDLAAMAGEFLRNVSACS